MTGSVRTQVQALVFDRGNKHGPGADALLSSAFEQRRGGKDHTEARVGVKVQFDVGLSLLVK